MYQKGDEEIRTNPTEDLGKKVEELLRNQITQPIQKVALSEVQEITGKEYIEL